MIDIERNVKYNEYLKNKIPKTKPWPTLFHAFWVGGIICLLGELCKDGWAWRKIKRSDIKYCFCF